MKGGGGVGVGGAILNILNQTHAPKSPNTHCFERCQSILGHLAAAAGGGGVVGWWWWFVGRGAASLTQLQLVRQR